jgi:hypothetical protein
MTKAEYEKLYRQARREFPLYLRDTMRQLEKVYREAAKQAAARVAKSTLAGHAALTTESWDAITRELEKGAALIRAALEKETPELIRKSIYVTSDIQTDYLKDAVLLAGATDRIGIAAIDTIYRSVNDLLVRSLVTRVWQDGYKFSDRVWKVGSNYTEQIKLVISSGLAQGRDPVKIARDIQVYTRDGKISLVNRYGPTLERGTKEFMKRIGNRIDSRALRLVRSELYASLQDASKEQGHINPGCTDMYDWVMESGRQHWDCECPELADGSPYEYSQVPGFPHPHCRCMVVPRLRSNREFQADLKAWVNGESVDYLDRWENEVYYRYVA